jgi:hypothetical protein
MWLYVDDVRETPDGYQRARTVDEAIRILDTQDVEVLSLDHDIMCQGDVKNGMVVSAHTSPETYEPVARFVARLPEDRRPKWVIIHTSNGTAANKMLEILRGKVERIDIAPGGRLARIIMRDGKECTRD